MRIPDTYFIFINVGVILLYIIFAISAYRKGLLLQAISLVYTVLSLLLAWFLAPIIAARFPLVKIDEMYKMFDLTPLVNSLIYCVIIFLLLRLLYLFLVPLFKSVSKIPFLGAVNKVGGLFFGLVNATIVVLLLSLLLNTPVISNRAEVKENTIFKYTDKLTDFAVKFTVDKLNLESLKEKIKGFDVDEAREKFTEWLEDKGILNE